MTETESRTSQVVASRPKKKSNNVKSSIVFATSSDREYDENLTKMLLRIFSQVEIALTKIDKNVLYANLGNAEPTK